MCGENELWIKCLVDSQPSSLKQQLQQQQNNINNNWNQNQNQTSCISSFLFGLLYFSLLDRISIFLALSLDD